MTAQESGRLDKFLAAICPAHSRSKLASWANEGHVLVDGKPRDAGFKLRPGMEVEFEEPAEKRAHDLTPAGIPLDVRFEDDFVLVINKPRGLAVHPASSLREPSLVNALLARDHGLSAGSAVFRPGIVHRLDKDTTGLILVAKTDRAHAGLAKQIELKTAVRRYLAVALGEIDHERFTVTAPITRKRDNRKLMDVGWEGKPAVTHFKRLAVAHEQTLLACLLDTGRTHQIRVHLRSIGYPVLGDRSYGPKAFQFGPMQLHAGYLKFRHPISGEEIEIYAGPPPDFLDWPNEDIRRGLSEW